MRNDTAYRTSNGNAQSNNNDTVFGSVTHMLSAAILIGSLFAALIVFSSHANAQTVMQGQAPAIDRSDVVEQLDTKHHESPVARGLGANGAMFEVFAKDDGGTWTIIMTLPDGSSRMLAAGEHWTNVPIQKIRGPKI